ncbi:mitochondrial tRNA-specific 2-thiouridylase 1-like [Dorcoceras hygrometricum]|uniref:Mitochondrial tRNA-specific 2-thiouridylase 1-like n=1 Tax=Dorcoceras hygrometricum TaxID=472368 RepID=A0A2Z7BLC4_9LAMI|nr:mitochondrial tRNA-specific 2-thiouridylase 1-like [Dorcoceras hygrometricum]
MPSRRGRSRRSDGSRAPDSDEDVHQAPGSDQFHEETGTSRYAAVDYVNQVHDRKETPSSACTIRPGEISADGNSSKSWPEQIPDTASRGPTTIVAPESQFRTCPTDHDSIGYPRMSASGESSTTMHRLLHASGSHPIPPPNDPKTNQYNQDLGLIHSTNGNHLESPNEDSSIDHQVTIYLHAQNITMFPTNETWYFASQILVSSSGSLILILTAQSTRNMFRIHSDY